MTPPFRMKIDSGQPFSEELLLLNLSALNPLFEGLDDHDLHIWLSEDKTRGLSYGQYCNKPSSLLSTSYQGVDQTRPHEMRWLDEEQFFCGTCCLLQFGFSHVLLHIKYYQPN